MPEQKILLIDNDYGFVSDIKELLEKNGFQVFLALSSQKGMELARTHFPSLILLEVDLPEMDGLEICRELRKISAFHGSYIVSSVRVMTIISKFLHITRVLMIF